MCIDIKPTKNKDGNAVFSLRVLYLNCEYFESFKYPKLKLYRINLKFEI